jgi:hypothetical protein
LLAVTYNKLIRDRIPEIMEADGQHGVRDKVIDVGVFGFDLSAAVETSAFLVAVERVAGAGDRPAANFPPSTASSSPSGS